MRIIFFVPYPTQGPSNRYRVEQYLPYLEKAGIRYRLCPFWSSAAYAILYKDGLYLKKTFFFIISTLRRIFDVFNALTYDLVFIHRETYPVGGAFFEELLSAFGKRIVFDFDDSIFLPAVSRSNRFVDKFKNPQKVVRIIELSRQVIAGNNYLADFARHYSDYVSVIPTCIEMSGPRTTAGRKTKGDKLVIGWMGSATTIEFIYSLRGVMGRLIDKYPCLEFRIIGGDYGGPALAGIVARQWSGERELAELSDFDIGIMPMPDNIWTKGKCGFKAILYMSMGIPVVCSPVGVNNEIVEHGKNGLLASTEDEWFDCLCRLIEDPRLRAGIGAAGKKIIEERYSVSKNVDKILLALQSAAAGKGARHVL